VKLAPSEGPTSVGSFPPLTPDKENKVQTTANVKHNVGFEDLTVLVVKMSIFWDIMPYSPLKVN
jgi:hypothetical protein